MTPRAMQDDPMLSDTVNQQPIRIHMTFQEASKITGQWVLSKNFGQRRTSLHQPDEVLERFIVERITRNSSLQAAEVSKEAPREDNLLHNRLRCAIASFAVLNRTILPARSSRRDCSRARLAAAFSS